jgi:hypothetical protein
MRRTWGQNLVTLSLGKLFRTFKLALYSQIKYCAVLKYVNYDIRGKNVISYHIQYNHGIFFSGFSSQKIASVLCSFYLRWVWLTHSPLHCRWIKLEETPRMYIMLPP